MKKSILLSIAVFSFFFASAQLKSDLFLKEKKSAIDSIISRPQSYYDELYPHDNRIGRINEKGKMPVISSGYMPAVPMPNAYKKENDFSVPIPNAVNSTKRKP